MTHRFRNIRCPTCAKKGLRSVMRNVKTRVGKRAITVRGVPVEECPHCGERLYDLAALARIREARAASRRRRAA